MLKLDEYWWEGLRKAEVQELVILFYFIYLLKKFNYIGAYCIINSMFLLGFAVIWIMSGRFLTSLKCVDTMGLFI